MKGAVVIVLLIFSVAVRAQKGPVVFTRFIQPSVFALTNVMLHDVVNPPAASRYYAYCLLGAYEIVSQNDTAILPLSSFIKSYKRISITESPATYNYQVAALYCILETGKQMLPSGYLLEEEEQKLLQSFQKKFPAALVQQSVTVAKEVTAGILLFSKTDHYRELSAKLRYTPAKGEGMWYPTPPAYIEAVEPHWKAIRTMLIDSCNQFVPARPVTFSKDSGSAFYRLSKEVYSISKHPTQEQLSKAAFWDCNPFAVSTSGHMAIGFKKISPGAHWMNIASIAAKKAGLQFNQSIVVHTVLAVTIMDAFISCWDEKYRSNRIRPETYINRYIDARWEPLLQTPPFPEYPSGHSVISAASAEVLTYFLGGSFSFTDDTEVLFDIPPRSFSSFLQAADEAAISRLYGGIHFRDAVENGQEEGRAVGSLIVQRIKATGMAPFKITHQLPAPVTLK